MPLTNIIDKLSKKYNEFRLKRALNSAIDKDISERSSFIKYGSIALTPFALPLIFEKPAYAQVQSNAFNIYEADLQDISLVNSFYSSNFNFVPSNVFNLQIGNSNYIFAKNPETRNLWYREFVNSRAIGQAREINNTNDITSFTALNFDNIEDDEYAVLFYNNAWHLYNINSIEDFLSDLRNRNGLRLDSNIIASLFNLSQQPQYVASFNLDNQSYDDGIFFSQQSTEINSNNATFRDNYGNFYNATGFLRNLENRVNASFNNLSSINRNEGDKIVLIQAVQPSLARSNASLPEQLTLNENSSIELEVNPNLNYRFSGNNNIEVSFRDGRIIFTPYTNFSGRELITITGLDPRNNQSSSRTLELIVNNVNDAPEVELVSNRANAILDQRFNLGSLIRNITDPDNDEVTIRFFQRSGPNVNIENPNSLNAYFIPILPGTYSFTLEASDTRLIRPVNIDINVPGVLFNAILRDYMTRELQNNVRVRIDNKECTTLEGRCNIALAEQGIKEVSISGQGLIPEIVRANIRNDNYTLEWITVPDTFPLDLFEAFYLSRYRRLIKWQNPENINAQIATRPTVIARWNREIPASEMEENVRLIRLLYRAGIKLMYNIDVPDSAIRDVGGNPTYGPEGNLVVDWDDVSLPESFLSARGIFLPNIESPYITAGRATFRTDLRTRTHLGRPALYLASAKEILGILWGVTGDPLTSENRTLFSNGFSGDRRVRFEEGIRNLLALENVQNPGELVYAISPAEDQQVVTLARQIPAGFEIRTISSIRTLYSPATQ